MTPPHFSGGSGVSRRRLTPAEPPMIQPCSLIVYALLYSGRKWAKGYFTLYNRGYSIRLMTPTAKTMMITPYE
jgi:hypothetical protein